MAVPIVMGEHQQRLMAYRKGEVDLCLMRGKWMLAATCDIPETEEFKATDWLGVRLRYRLAWSIATAQSTPEPTSKARRRHRTRRNALQKRGTKAAKRRLRIGPARRRGTKHTNHCISKAVVRC